jgi:DNA-binding XRE family transcriptional regulator
MIELVKNGPGIENWCRNNGYTKDQLAFELGVTRQTLFNWTKNLDSVPRVLALSLFALERMPIEARSNVGSKVRKKTKRQE